MQKKSEGRPQGTALNSVSSAGSLADDLPMKPPPRYLMRRVWLHHFLKTGGSGLNGVWSGSSAERIGRSTSFCASMRRRPRESWIQARLTLFTWLASLQRRLHSVRMQAA